jgi:hypothetical protein
MGPAKNLSGTHMDKWVLVKITRLSAQWQSTTYRVDTVSGSREFFFCSRFTSHCQRRAQKLPQLSFLTLIQPQHAMTGFGAKVSEWRGCQM